MQRLPRWKPRKAVLLLGLTALPILGQSAPTQTQKARTEATLKEAATLHAPLDSGRVVAVPAKGLEVELEGTPLFVHGQRGEALSIAPGGLSTSSLEIQGKTGISPERGTIAFWVRPLLGYDPGREYYLLSLLSSADAAQGLCAFVDEQGRFVVQGRATAPTAAPDQAEIWIHLPPWPPDRWYHLAVTWAPDQNTVFYLDGEKQVERTDSPAFSGQKAPVDRIVLGCSPAGDKHAHSVFDDILVFAEPLAEKELKTLAKRTKKTPNEQIERVLGKR